MPIPMQAIQALTHRVYVRGLYRAIWLVRGLFMNKSGIYPVGDGLLMGIDEGHYYEFMMIVGYYSPEMNRLLKVLLSEGDSVVDVGANIGYITIQAAKAVGPDGRVLAIDADPRPLTILRANVTSNDLSSVQIIEAACAEADHAKLSFQLNASVGWSSLAGPDEVTGGAEILEVEARTIDSLVEEFLSAKPPALIKIDVEGNEPRVLAGAEQTISEGQTAFILEVNSPRLDANRFSVGDILSPFRGKRYSAFWIIEDRPLMKRLDRVRLDPIIGMDAEKGRNGDLLVTPSGHSALASAVAQGKVVLLGTGG